MKRLLVILFLLSTLSLGAQEKRYEKELNLAIGIGKNTSSGVSIQVAFRGRLNDYVSFGLGMNLDYYIR